MSLKCTKFISSGTFIAFDAVQIILLDKFVSIYPLLISNRSVCVLVFLPYHGLQNCNADYFAFKRLIYPLKCVSSAEKFHIALKPALQRKVHEMKK